MCRSTCREDLRNGTLFEIGDNTSAEARAWQHIPTRPLFAHGAPGADVCVVEGGEGIVPYVLERDCMSTRTLPLRESPERCVDCSPPRSVVPGDGLRGDIGS